MIRNSIDSYGHLGEYIISCQEKNGAIAWEPRSKIDPWDHVESAMGLDILGYEDNSKKAYGSTTRKLKLNTNFKGTKNGEVTPVAIKEEFCPNEVIIGSEKKL